MIYIILTIVSVINIFNIGLIANNSITQNQKEKILLVTYSMAELVYIMFIVFLVEYTAVNMVLVLSFIIIWLLSKAYILIINMNFENIEGEGNNNMQENDNLDMFQTDNNIGMISEEIDQTEVVSEVEPDKLELSNLENAEEIKLSEVLESNSINEDDVVFVANTLHSLEDILNTKEINKVREQQTRRRSLALKISKLNNSD